MRHGNRNRILLILFLPAVYSHCANMATIRTKETVHEGTILGRQGDNLHVRTETGIRKIPLGDIGEISHPGTSRVIWGSGLVALGIVMIFAGRDSNCRDSCAQPLGPLDTLGYLSAGLGGILAVSGGISWYVSAAAEGKNIPAGEQIARSEARYSVGLAYRF